MVSVCSYKTLLSRLFGVFCEELLPPKLCPWASSGAEVQDRPPERMCVCCRRGLGRPRLRRAEFSQFRGIINLGHNLTCRQVHSYGLLRKIYISFKNSSIQSQDQDRLLSGMGRGVLLGQFHIHLHTGSLEPLPVLWERLFSCISHI